MDAPAIQPSSKYQEAVRRYAAKDYSGALNLINQLLTASNLSPADQAFLQRQRAICRDALSSQSKSSVPSPALPAPKAVLVTSSDCGPRALLLVCRELHVPADLETLHRAAGTTRDGTSLAGLAKAAGQVGLKAKGVQMDKDALAKLSAPALAWVDGNHFVAVLQVAGDRATVHDPNKDRKEELALMELLARSGGILLTLAR